MVDKFTDRMFRSNPDFVFTVTVISCAIAGRPYWFCRTMSLLSVRRRHGVRDARAEGRSKHLPWKEPKERIPLAVRQIRSFLKANRPA